MNKHTSGPWWAVQSSNRGWDVKTYRDKSDMSPEEDAEIKWQYGATICMGVGDHTEARTRGNEEANAKLIAAAPTLYNYVKKKSNEGCKEAKSMLDSLQLID